MTIEQKQAHHESICKNLTETYVKKNIDYGDSFTDGIDKFGLVSAATRLNDKNNRIGQLITSDKQNVKDESLKDSLLDIANYCIMTVMHMEGDSVDRIEKQDKLKNIASESSAKGFNCGHNVHPVGGKSIFKGIESFVGVERPVIKPDDLQDILFGGNNTINLADLGYEKINVSTKFQEGDKIVYKPSLDGECVYTYEKYGYSYKTSYNVHEIGAVVEVSDNTGGIYIVPSEKLINQEYYIKKGV